MRKMSRTNKAISIILIALLLLLCSASRLICWKVNRNLEIVRAQCWSNEFKGESADPTATATDDVLPPWPTEEPTSTPELPWPWPTETPNGYPPPVTPIPYPYYE